MGRIKVSRKETESESPSDVRIPRKNRFDDCLSFRGVGRDLRVPREEHPAQAVEWAVAQSTPWVDLG